jgi:SSS family solute:Na+ symporter
VVDNALAVAGFVMGPLLGVFLLGILTRRVGQRAAFVGMTAGIAATAAVTFGTKVAYPWYSVVGASTVFIVALIASHFLPNARAPEPLNAEL